MVIPWTPITRSTAFGVAPVHQVKVKRLVKILHDPCIVSLIMYNEGVGTIHHHQLWAMLCLKCMWSPKTVSYIGCQVSRLHRSHHDGSGKYYVRSGPPSCATAFTNFSWSSGVHRKRVFTELSGADAAAPEDGPGLPPEPPPGKTHKLLNPPCHIEQKNISGEIKGLICQIPSKPSRQQSSAAKRNQLHWQ